MSPRSKLFISWRLFNIFFINVLEKEIMSDRWYEKLSIIISRSTYLFLGYFLRASIYSLSHNDNDIFENGNNTTNKHLIGFVGEFNVVESFSPQRILLSSPYQLIYEISETLFNKFRLLPIEKLGSLFLFASRYDDGASRLAPPRIDHMYQINHQDLQRLRQYFCQGNIKDNKYPINSKMRRKREIDTTLINEYTEDEHRLDFSLPKIERNQSQNSTFNILSSTPPVFSSRKII